MRALFLLSLLMTSPAQALDRDTLVGTYTRMPTAHGENYGYGPCEEHVALQWQEDFRARQMNQPAKVKVTSGPELKPFETVGIDREEILRHQGDPRWPTWQDVYFMETAFDFRVPATQSDGTEPAKRTITITKKKITFTWSEFFLDFHIGLFWTDHRMTLEEKDGNHILKVRKRDDSWSKLDCIYKKDE